MTAARILIVDAFRDEADMYAEYLLAAGHRVHVCRDPERALDVARRTRPDLVIVRRRSSAGSVVGDALTNALRARRVTGRTPVLILSSATEKLAEREALRAGADAYVLIPCLPRDLDARVRDLLRRARSARAARTRLGTVRQRRAG